MLQDARCIEKPDNLVRIKEKSTELSCIISPPIWQWIKKNLLKNEEETCGNRYFVIQKEAEDTMNQTTTKL